MQSNTFSRVVLIPMMSAVGIAAFAQQAPSVTAPVAAEPAVNQGSSVRIVRVSQVLGAVRMDRNVNRGFETAFANIPVVAGASLRSAQGAAEVELEDNSSLRLGPESEVRFTQLSRMPTGGTITTVEVVKGLVYVSLEKTKGNAFSLKQGAAEMVLSPGAHVRLDAHGADAQFAVLDGSAAVQMGSTLTAVAKHQTVELNPAQQTVSAVVHGTEEGALDAWDKRSQQYHNAKASFSGNAGGYGVADLNYYGSFSDMPGCGSAWRPYFANAAWDPYGAGVWAYYPQSGYSWVSPYPWGWLPFHSGSWVSCGAAGWGWQPGNSFYGLNNVAMMNRIKRPTGHPVPTPPLRNAGALVPVNMRSAAVSGASEGDRFTFRENSAGLGVPRQTFGQLRSVASSMERHGAAMGVVPSGASAARNAGGAPQIAANEISISRPMHTLGVASSMRQDSGSQPMSASRGGALAGSSAAPSSGFAAGSGASMGGGMRGGASTGGAAGAGGGAHR